MNHNMDNMENIQHFTRGIKVLTRMFLGASVGGITKMKNEDGVKELIKRMC